MLGEKRPSRDVIDEKADRMKKVIQELIALETYFNSKVTSRTTIDMLLNADTEEAKKYKKLMEEYIQLYDFLGKYDKALLKRIIKEYEENEEHKRFIRTIVREKRKKEDDLEKLEDNLNELRDKMDERVKEMAKNGELQKFYHFYEFEELWKQDEDVEKIRAKYKEGLKTLFKASEEEHEKYIEHTKGWFEHKLYKYNIEIEKTDERLAYEAEKMAKMQGLKEEEKETSFMDNLFGFLFGSGEYYDEEAEGRDLEHEGKEQSEQNKHQPDNDFINDLRKNVVRD